MEDKVKGPPHSPLKCKTTTTLRKSVNTNPDLTLGKQSHLSQTNIYTKIKPGMHSLPNSFWINIKRSDEFKL